MLWVSDITYLDQRRKARDPAVAGVSSWVRRSFRSAGPQRRSVVVAGDGHDVLRIASTVSGTACACAVTAIGPKVSSKRLVSVTNGAVHW